MSTSVVLRVAQHENDAGATMEGTGREVDLAGRKPGYRALIRNPLKALGTRRLLPKSQLGRRRPVPVARETDLTQGPEGQPGPRADIEWFTLGLHVRYGDAEARVEASGSPHSPQGIAIAAVLLIAAGVLCGLGALAGGVCCGLPLIPVAAVALLVMAAPSGAYYLMRRRKS
jgi:hypothetical protein